MTIKRVDRDQFSGRKPYSRFVLFGGNICMVIYHFIGNNTGVEVLLELNDDGKYTEGYGVADIMDDAGVTSALYAALYDVGIVVVERSGMLPEALKMIANAFLMSNYSIAGGAFYEQKYTNTKGNSITAPKYGYVTVTYI